MWQRRSTCVLAAALTMLGIACDDDPAEDGDQGLPDAVTDLADEDDATTSDISDADPDAPDADPWEGFTGVRIDLDSYRAAAGSGAALRVAAAEDLIHGQQQISRVGDYYLANDRIRAIVRGDDRYMGAAPYGGQIIEADLVRAEGEPGQSAYGALSLLVNFGRTLVPDAYHVLYDGTSGGAVLAVTGHDSVIDFINVPLLLEQELGAVGRLQLDPDDETGLTITSYYVINPGETRVRVVTALRNDSEEDRIVAVGELVDPGGDTELFNPSRRDNRFGEPPQPVPEPAEQYLAWVSDAIAYAYVPRLEGEQPTLSMSVSGITGSVLGANNLIDFTGEQPLDPQNLPQGAVLLAPGDVHVVARDFYVGRDLAAVDAAWHADSGRALGEVAGTLDLEADIPPSTRVAALGDNGRVVTVFAVEADGSFGGRLPPATYTLRADAPGHPYSEPVEVTVEEGGTASVTVSPPAAVEVTVTVTTPDGSPSPAKVSFVCEGVCPKDLIEGGRHYRASSRDRLPPNVQLVGFVGPSGQETFRVPAGDYRVVVSRGAEYSVWPNGWPTDPGTLHSWAAGDSAELDAEIALVLNTTGFISGDLHIHGIASPDSYVHHTRRVLSMLAEGVDVMVSTDHEFVTDWAPYIEELGAESFIASLIGNELTTFDWGHFNTYPTEVNPDARNGSYIDWGDGEGPTYNPTQMFEAMAEVPSPAPETVIQVNHPRGTLGYFTAIGLDTASFATATDPTIFRMVPPAGSEVGVDTRLFDTSFTAMEIYNGWRLSAFYPRLNDWFAFLQRGFAVTAVAVSDTHREFSDAVGSPRTWIDVGGAADTPETLDVTAFVRGINDGHVMGGNGPFIRVRAVSGDGEAGPGDLLSLANPDDAVFLEISVEVPTWFGIDAIEIYANIAGTDARPYQEVSTPPTPTLVIDVDLDSEESVPGVSVAGEAESPHRRWVIERTQAVEPDADTWYVIMVRGSDPGFPVTLEPDVTALAFTNAILVDVNGDGDFDPPAPVARGPIGIWAYPTSIEVGRAITDADLGRVLSREH